MHPFTEAGVADLMEEMYALTDGQLAVQASAARNDFKNLILENIDADQETYLDNMPSNGLKT